jgi:hypothetical protein
VDVFDRIVRQIERRGHGRSLLVLVEFVKRRQPTAMQNPGLQFTMSMFDSSLERLIRQAARYTFGVFATMGSVDEMHATAGGSGIFIGPFQGLTARHVSEYFVRLDGRDNRPKYRFRTQHSIGLFQLLDPFDQASSRALWHVDQSWNSAYSDLTLLEISAEDQTSDRIQYNWPAGFFELQLLPPPRGSRVVVIGFPGLSTEATGGTQINVDAPFTVKEGTVTKIYQIRADLGQLTFPCFEIDIHVAGGFSGGPAFFEGRLCGLVSQSPTFEARSTIATLWPLALMKGKGELGDWSLAAQLDNGSLRACDWLDVKPRISIEEGEHGKYAFLRDAGYSDSRDA